MIRGRMCAASGRRSNGIAGDHDGAGTGSCKGEVGVYDVGGR